MEGTEVKGIPRGRDALDVTIVGSGTLLPDPQHSSAAHWVQGDRFRLLLDCGSGTVHGLARYGLPWHKLTHLAVTHFHTDHVGDLPALLWALRHGCGPERDEPLTLVGPPGVESFLDRVAAAFGDFVLDPGFSLTVEELPLRGRWSSHGDRFTLETLHVPHTDESVAYRVESGGACVGYTGDTGPSGELGSFFRGVDLLVAECSIPDPTELDNHLSPRTLADLARAADPELVVVTHCYPELDRTEVPDLLAASGYMGRCLPGVGGMRLRVSRGGVRVAEGA